MNSNFNFEKRIRKSPDSRGKTKSSNDRGKNPKLIERRVTRKHRLRQKGVA